MDGSTTPIWDLTDNFAGTSEIQFRLLIQTIPVIAYALYDEKRGYLLINLIDGTILIDRGDAIIMRGPGTWQAISETAAAAERHGWKSIEVSRDQAYKDAVVVTCVLHGIKVTLLIF